MRNISFETLSETSMLIQFQYKVPLSKERLVSLVGEVFPGVVKKDEQLAQGGGEGLPPGVEIVVENAKFFISSDKSVITLRGKPLADDFFRAWFSYLQDWFTKAMPELFTLISYRELHILPMIDGITKFSDILSDLPGKEIFSLNEDYCHLLFNDTRYLKSCGTYVASERTLMKIRGRWCVFYRITGTKNVELTSLEDILNCLTELKEIVRQKCDASIVDKYKEVYNE